MMTTARIDTDTLNRQVDARQWLDFGQLRRVAGTGGGEYAGPCPKCGGRDRFHVQPDAPGGVRWLCRQCTGRLDDGIALVRFLRGVDFLDACRMIAGGEPPTSPDTAATAGGELQARPFSPPPPTAWQAAAQAAAWEAAQELAAGYAWFQQNGARADVVPPPAAMAALYLMRRGLTQSTVQYNMLGFNPAWRQLLAEDADHPRGYLLAPGITIPCFSGIDSHLWYINVRRSEEDLASERARGRQASKYLAATGSQLKSLFNATALLSATQAIVVEGEFDCLLLQQEIGDMAAVVTMGSAGTIADAGGRWAGYLHHLQRLFVCLDPDEAGFAGSIRWRQAWPHAVVVHPPGEGDFTDFWRAGGDLAQWARSILT